MAPASNPDVEKTPTRPSSTMRILAAGCERILERLSAVVPPDRDSAALRAACERHIAVFSAWHLVPPDAAELRRVHAEVFEFYQAAVHYLDGRPE